SVNVEARLALEAHERHAGRWIADSGLGEVAAQALSGRWAILSETLGNGGGEGPGGSDDEDDREGGDRGSARRHAGATSRRRPPVAPRGGSARTTDATAGSRSACPKSRCRERTCRA